MSSHIPRYENPADRPVQWLWIPILTTCKPLDHEICTYTHYGWCSMTWEMAVDGSPRFRLMSSDFCR